MKNTNMESTLRDWIEEMVNRFQWLKVKFEYSEERGIFLVSYSPSTKIDECDAFIKESIDFENRMNSLYEDDAPLFCDEEKYLKLSDKAEVVEYRKYEYFDVNIVTCSQTETIWDIQTLSSETWSNSYALAA